MKQPTSRSSKPWAVELVNVTKRFADVVAVDNASLQVCEGEFFSLLGPSGCGKTTTLRMIAGFDEPTEGQIYVHDQPVAGIPPYRRPVNTVFQSYALFPHMTVAQNIAFGLEMKKAPKAEIRRRVVEVLQLVQLPALGDRRPRQLSGGQQQRVALARALVNRPEVLLLDEPLSALDLKLRKAMRLELKQIQAEVGITFVYVTHDQEEALTMSDRIAVMNDGLIQQVGSPRQIYEHPVNRFVADFIGETNFVAAVVAEPGDPATVMIGDVPVLGVTDGRNVAVGQEVTVALRPEKVKLYPKSDVSPARTWLSAEEFNQMAGASGLPAEQKGESHTAEKHFVVVDGRVEEAIYVGTDTRYLVKLNGDTNLFVRAQNFGARQDPTFLPGDEVFVHWLADNAQILTD